MSLPLVDAPIVGTPLLRVEDLYVTFTGKARLLGRGRAPVVA